MYVSLCYAGSFCVSYSFCFKATDGWYTSQAIEKIKVVLRHKFFQLLQGHIATEEECEAMLDEPLSKATMKSRAPKPRMGKHNMAKGALPPEELAVCVGSHRMSLSEAEEVSLGNETPCSTSKEYAKAVVDIHGHPSQRYRRSTEEKCQVQHYVVPVIRCFLSRIRVGVHPEQCMRPSRRSF